MDKTRERCGTTLRCSCLQVENPGLGRCDGNDCIKNLITIFAFYLSPVLGIKSVRNNSGKVKGEEAKP